MMMRKQLSTHDRIFYTMTCVLSWFSVDEGVAGFPDPFNIVLSVCMAAATGFMAYWIWEVE